MTWYVAHQYAREMRLWDNVGATVEANADMFCILLDTGPRIYVTTEDGCKNVLYNFSNGYPRY
jgi:hypothetical protein